MNILPAGAPLPRPVNEMRVFGRVPSSIAYLHGLIAMGQANHYDWDQGKMTINVLQIDTKKETSLQGIDRITIEYETVGVKV